MALRHEDRFISCAKCGDALCIRRRDPEVRGPCKGSQPHRQSVMSSLLPCALAGLERNNEAQPAPLGRAVGGSSCALCFSVVAKVALSVACCISGGSCQHGPAWRGPDVVGMLWAAPHSNRRLGCDSEGSMGKVDFRCGCCCTRYLGASCAATLPVVASLLWCSLRLAAPAPIVAKVFPAPVCGQRLGRSPTEAEVLNAFRRGRGNC